jgi:hypothetical protein
MTERADEFLGDQHQPLVGDTLVHRLDVAVLADFSTASRTA